MHGGKRRDRKIPGVDVAIDQLQLILYPLQDLHQLPAGIRRAPLELQIGDQPAQPQDRRRGARLGVGGRERRRQRCHR